MFVSYLTAFNAIGSVICEIRPSCDVIVIAIGMFLAPAGLRVIFGASVLVSAVLLNRERPAYFIPIWGSVAMVGCALLSTGLIASGLGAVR